MSDPIKYNSTPTSEPIGGAEENYEYPNPLDNYEGGDWEGGGDFGNISGTEGGDEFIGGDEGGGGGGSYPSDMSPNGLRYWLDDLKKQGAITQEQFITWTGQVNAASGLRDPAGQAHALDQVISAVNTHLYPPAPVVPEASADDPFGIDAAMEGEGTEEDSGLKGEIDSFIERVNGNENLSEAAKLDFVGDAERLLADFELVKDEPDAQYRIEEELSNLQTRYTEFLTMPESAQTLADKYTNGDVGKVMEAAEKHNIDLNELPEPPSTDVFEFLAELDPTIGDALETAQDAIREKKDTDDEMVRRATEDSAENSRSTTGSGYDGVDMEAFRYLSSARYFEDSGSEAVAVAFSGLTSKLVDGLKELYPDESINIVGSGFKEADLIKFGGETIDVLSNKEGEFIAGNEGADSDLDIPEMVTLEYDWEGDGDWEDKSNLKNFLNEMKDVGYPTHCYD